MFLIETKNLNLTFLMVCMHKITYLFVKKSLLIPNKFMCYEKFNSKYVVFELYCFFIKTNIKLLIYKKYTFL